MGPLNGPRVVTGGSIDLIGLSEWFDSQTGREPALWGPVLRFFSYRCNSF
jgi:hypothetical protein